MANTNVLLATSQGQIVQAQSGTNYTAVNGVFTGVAIGNDTIDLIKAGATLLAPNGEGPGALPLVTGRFYGIPNGDTPAALLTVASTLYAYPVYIPQTITIKTLNLSVTTGQTAGAAHLGIYADNGGYPGTLIYDSGTNTGLTTTAVLTVTPTAGSVVLTPGWYWLASAFSASGTYISVAGTGTGYIAAGDLLGFDTAAHALATSGEAPTGISVTFTYGSLPTTFTTGATLSLGAATPLISLGV